MITNAKEAHKAGRVWVDLKINGGPVTLESDGKGGSIGRIDIKGAFTPLDAMTLYQVATGRKARAAAADAILASREQQLVTVRDLVNEARGYASDELLRSTLGKAQAILAELLK